MVSKSVVYAAMPLTAGSGVSKDTAKLMEDIVFSTYQKLRSE